MYSVSVEKLADEFKLKNELPDISLKGRIIKNSAVNRPALQLAGFFDYFESDAIQVIGKVEHAYLERLEPVFREQVLRELFSYKFPCFIVCAGLEIFPEILVFSEEFNVPVFSTDVPEPDFIENATRWLKNELAQRVTIHGVLVDIYGVGVLIIGDSGIGKSETALELIKRGHRLVADDAVEIKKLSYDTLQGTCPELIKHFIEIRGIGVIDVKELFGVGSVKQIKNIELVIKLEMWENGKVYSRIGLNDEHYDIMGVKIPSNTIPVRPGRNTAVICEVAAMNVRQRLVGYSAEEILNERLKAMSDNKNNGGAE